MPKETEEAVVYTLELLGPCTLKELQWALGKPRANSLEWNDLVSKGVIVILQEEDPHTRTPRLFGLPKDKLDIDNVFRV